MRDVDALIKGGGWKDWLIRAPLVDWQGIRSNRRRNYFRVWKGREKGFFYKWIDCWRSIRGIPDPGFIGHDTMDGAMAELGNGG